MSDDEREGLKRREFLASVGRALGSSAVVKSLSAMGIAAGASACGSSSAGESPPPGGVSPPPPPPPPATHAPRPGDWPASVGVGRSVVVLGAGIAGMTAALELGRLGYDVSILEATARAGGRNRTLRSGDVAEESGTAQTCSFDLEPDLYFNPGPARIAHHHEFLLGYCREFGVALEPFINANRAALLHSSAAFGGEPQLTRRVVADIRGTVAELLAGAVDQGALDQALSATDRINLLAMLQNFGALSAGNSYTGSERAGFPGQAMTGSRQRGDILPPLDRAELLAELFFEARGDYGEILDQQPTMLQPVGGMDRIANAFEAQVSAKLAYEAVVTEIRKTASGVRVVYRDRLGASREATADHCLCTIPATVLADIPNDFSAAHRAAIADFRYTASAKIAFQSRRFWEQDRNIYGGISWTDQDITQLWYPSHGLGRANGVLLGSYIFGGPAGEAFSALTPQQRIDTTLNQADVLHPEFRAEAARGISVAWSNVPFQLGGWGVSDPGVLLSPDDAVHFAGEHLSILQGWQEGAILSAYHAIDNIVTADSQ